MDSISKRGCKTLVSKEEEDHISKLSDCVLADIISKHGTKFAAGTAVLSTRWKHLFALIPDIQLDDTLFKGYGEDDCYRPSQIQSSIFAKFTSRVLDEILKQVTSISNLALKLRGEYEDQQILDWIHAALECKVHVLDLDLFLHSEPAAKLFQLISGCKSLHRLTLGCDLFMKVPSSFSLPSLGFLVLDGTNFEDDEEFCSLISGLPSLQSLTLRELGFYGITTIKIVSSSLKHLTIEECWCTFYPYGGKGTRFILDAPALEEFYYMDCLAERIVIKNLESIRVANFNICLFEEDPEAFVAGRNFDTDVHELVRACSSAQTVFLLKDTLPALQVLNKPVPVFHNLTDLQLNGLDKDCGKLLRTILQYSPKLDVSKKLAIEEDFVKSFGFDALPSS